MFEAGVKCGRGQEVKDLLLNLYPMLFLFSFFFQSLRLLGKEPRRPSKPLSRSRRKDLIALITVLSLSPPISMRSTRLCHATVVLRYVFRDLPHHISLGMSNARTGSIYVWNLVHGCIWYLVQVAFTNRRMFLL